MRTLNLIAGLLMLIALNGCQTFKDLRKHSYRKDSTATEVKKMEVNSTTREQGSDNKQDNAYNTEENDMERLTEILQYSKLDSNGHIVGNVTHTRIKEKGKQSLQSNTSTRQQTDWTNATNDAQTSVEKKSTSLSTEEASKHLEVTRTGGWLLWAFLIFIAIVLLALLWVWKGHHVVCFVKGVKEVINFLRNGPPPNSPA